MDDNALDIILRLQDELSPALAKAQAAIKDSAAQLAGVNTSSAQSFHAVKESTDDSVEAFLRGIPIIGEFIAALSVERVAEFVLASVEATGRIEDLSRATGVSATAFQQLSYVGKEFGIDAEQMARGVEQLSAKLANGDANAVKAVQMLGLSVADLIAAGPKEAFLEVAEATGRVEDPMLKAALASDEFGGRLAKVLLPALGELREKMNAVPRGAILSDQNVVSAHELDVAWTHLKDVWGNVFVDLIVRGAEAFGAQTDKMRAATRAADEAAAASTNFVGPINQVLTAADLLNNRLTALRTEALLPLTDAQKGQIVELESYGVSHKEIADLVRTSEIAVTRYTTSLTDQAKAVKEAAAAAQKYADAWTQLESIGVSVRDTVAAINPQLRDQVQLYLDAGASVGVLAAAFPMLTQAQVQAMADLKKSTADGVLEITKLWDEYDQTRAKNTGTAIDAQIAAVDRWANDLAAKMQKNGTDTEAFYDALTATWSQKLHAVMVDTASLTQDLSTNTQAGLQQIADKAKATYAEALTHVGEFSDGTIEKYRLVADNAQLAADRFGTGFEDNAKKATQAIDGVVNAAQRAADAMKTFSLAGTPVAAQFQNMTRDQLVTAGLVDNQGHVTLLGAQAGLGIGPGGANVGTFQSRDVGGPVNAGQPYYVGTGAQPELFIPHSAGTMVPAGAGGIVNHIYVTQPLGTPQAIASAVDDAYSKRVGRSRQWPAA